MATICKNNRFDRWCDMPIWTGYVSKWDSFYRDTRLYICMYLYIFNYGTSYKRGAIIWLARCCKIGWNLKKMIYEQETYGARHHSFKTTNRKKVSNSTQPSDPATATIIIIIITFGTQTKNKNKLKPAIPVNLNLCCLGWSFHLHPLTLDIIQFLL